MKREGKIRKQDDVEGSDAADTSGIGSVGRMRRRRRSRTEEGRGGGNFVREDDNNNNGGSPALSGALLLLALAVTWKYGSSSFSSSSLMWFGRKSQNQKDHHDGTGLDLTSVGLSLCGGIVVAAFVVFLMLARRALAGKIPKADRMEIRFGVMEAREVLQEMIEAAAADDDDDDNNTVASSSLRVRRMTTASQWLTLRVGLLALAKKYEKERQRSIRRREIRRRTFTTSSHHQREKKTKKGTSTDLDDDANSDDADTIGPPASGGTDASMDDLALLCQQAAYLGFRFVMMEEMGQEQDSRREKRGNPSAALDDNDLAAVQRSSWWTPAVVAVASGSVSLLALVAKNGAVRERHLLLEPRQYALRVPIRCLERSLEAAKRHQDEADGSTTQPAVTNGGVPSEEDGCGANQNNKFHAVEQQSAELMRKGCLLLGALSSPGESGSGGALTGDDIASIVVQEGGMRWIVDTLDWFRYHSDVANWALWALFTACYEHPVRKSALVDLQVVPAALNAIRNCPDSVEVARHGTALLFDLMRETEVDGGRRCASDLGGPDPWKVRRVALGCGLHAVLIRNMTTFRDEMDIMMMSQEILVGTDYQGDIPQYRPTR
jgi:hypothetical protein